MPNIKVLHEMDYPYYGPGGEITVMRMVTVQVDDDLPLTVKLPKDGYTDQQLRAAVQAVLTERASRSKAGGPRTIPL